MYFKIKRWIIAFTVCTAIMEFFNIDCITYLVGVRYFITNNTEFIAVFLRMCAIPASYAFLGVFAILRHVSILEAVVLNYNVLLYKETCR